MANSAMTNVCGFGKKNPQNPQKLIHMNINLAKTNLCKN